MNSCGSGACGALHISDLLSLTFMRIYIQAHFSHLSPSRRTCREMSENTEAETTLQLRSGDSDSRSFTVRSGRKAKGGKNKKRHDKKEKAQPYRYSLAGQWIKLPFLLSYVCGHRYQHWPGISSVHKAGCV